MIQRRKTLHGNESAPTTIVADETFNRSAQDPVDGRLSYHRGMSTSVPEGESSAATAAYNEFLEPFEAAIETLSPLVEAPRGEMAATRSWSEATLHPGPTPEIRRAGRIHLRRRLVDRRLRIDLHRTLGLSSAAVLTAEGHLICRDDPWNSLESWDVKIEQRLTRASRKIHDESFDRISRGRVSDGALEVAGRTSERLPGGAIVSELIALMSPRAMVDALWLHLVRDFDAVARQQRFEELGVTRTYRGDLRVVLQTGVASLPTTYWLDASGYAAIVRHGTRLLVARAPATEWPGGAHE